MDSTRKTLYREDSLGGDQNRVRPRSYSFYDLIEDQEQGDQLSKQRRTREQQVRTPTTCTRMFSVEYPAPGSVATVPRCKRR